ncbi:MULTISPECIES: HAL/PAL/TAL family ammonia-lyase [Shewanella]|uniref:tyrosine ammonia-lyase n=1 Tax=Shewanella fidelis TaxID=173509 RepID=A0AAW8NRS5_9GAMM|nr:MULTISPECIES: aromatic amino acid ammonia-lyase [Shewanella]MDR8525505.1 aromatic amino acid ammonia-lyase [Shewanella fidelis]MDW4813176.1 aromatic amino acid ammonia-lyase [Shewanella fidelis]MDW4816944.1 aromatic amino acid ammonia-lyase [Shewanella fidelis]MDW4820103.1 aromatic amino acid ammonia-lyase [Shewanella fidelis]MDW4825641.1 aromatic amino acid ammonia-lyase [Shewanella fidelis]
MIQDTTPQLPAVTFGYNSLSLEDVVAIAKGAKAQLNQTAEYRSYIQKGAQFIDSLLQEEGVVYGVTTGYGDSCTVTVGLDLVHELPLHLTRFHGCGMGEILSPMQARAVMACRLSSLAIGKSGVSYELLQRIETLLNLDITPVIPEEGSVGASGDLTPLSYLAAVLVGERDVIYQGQRRPTSEVYQALNITPLKLRPKEGLALMNGTAVMTALACLAYDRAQYMARLASRITAMASLTLKGNSNHFDDILFAAKPHPGQNQIAAWIREDLNHHVHPRNSDRLQDRYSIRCAPHVIGVLQDALPFMRQFIETELNSANDNPIVDGEGEHVLHGGHFYGGHIAFAMDAMKNAVANIADLIDRQMALVMDQKFNNGLPANLSAATGERKAINHGFKAVQIGVSAWTAEALKNTMPASVFSRSTECHNQDKVSMGTISARDCMRVLQLTEQVAAAALLAMSQGIRLRIMQQELEASSLTHSLAVTLAQVEADFELLTEDRPLEQTLRATVDKIQHGYWEVCGKE